MNTLNSAQLSVIKKLLDGDNIFLTGGGGVGKSYLLSVIYNELPGIVREKTGKIPHIQMCALTGCAALLLGNKAKTLHSWAGIALGKGTVSELRDKIRKNRKAMRNWISTDLLIIDEISMMTAELLDKLNELAKKIRSNQSLFGGIQLLLVGDFFQLPPVNKSDEKSIFAFESELWKEIKTTIELTEILRQKDENFIAILKEARQGSLTKNSCDILRSRQDLNWRANKIKPTLLFPKRAEVDAVNDSNLRALTGKRYTYEARLIHDLIPSGYMDANFNRALELFDANAPFSVHLELTIGAQVMLIANIESGLVNGSRGVIIDFALDLPVVEFLNGIKRTVGNHSWPIEDYELVSRSQIPLRLAWASTCHKAQGITLDSALIDIGSSVFEYGQAYVALSRVRSLDALYVYDFDPLAFKAHPRVKEFYKNLVCELQPVLQPVLLPVLQPVLQPVLLPVCELKADIKSIICEVNEIRGINVIKEDEVKEDEVVGPSIGPVENWLYDSIPHYWKDKLSFDKLLEISNTLEDFLPSRENIWRALIPIESIKVVILGQDPYPNAEHACGLAFSTPSKKLPPSLKNIYKELHNDGFVAPSHGCLDSWSNQGVMLLNTILTIGESDFKSHQKLGWEEITDEIIHSIPSDVIFVLWGKIAQKKKKILNTEYIIESAHPSPLSASKGFFGSKPFSTINRMLIEMGKEPINWSI